MGPNSNTIGMDWNSIGIGQFGLQACDRRDYLVVQLNSGSLVGCAIGHRCWPGCVTVGVLFVLVLHHRGMQPSRSHGNGVLPGAGGACVLRVPPSGRFAYCVRVFLLCNSIQAAFNVAVVRTGAIASVRSTANVHCDSSHRTGWIWCVQSSVNHQGLNERVNE